MLDRTPKPAPTVLHLISSLRVGGAERLLVSSLQAAQAAGRTNYVVVIMNDAVDPALFGELVQTGFPVYWLARIEGHMHPRYLTSILKIIRMHDVGVIHCHNDGSRFWAMSAKAARPALKLVYTVHSQGNAGSIRGVSRIAYRRLVDATVSISDCVHQECGDLAPRRLTMIENGVDLSKFAIARAAAKPSQRLRLVHVGRFAPVKGQDILVEAVKAVVDAGCDVTCTLAGVVSDKAYFETVKARITALGLEYRITIDLDRLDIENVLAGADLFVLPSREEGFGLAIVEAMAAGLPVIVARVGGAAEIVHDGVDGLHFEPENAGDLARQILRLAHDRTLAGALAAAGMDAASRYDIQHTLAAHEQLYRALVPA